LLTTEVLCFDDRNLTVAEPASIAILHICDVIACRQAVRHTLTREANHMEAIKKEGSFPEGLEFLRLIRRIEDSCEATSLAAVSV
jgi:hypothetical protein